MGPPRPYPKDIMPAVRIRPRTMRRRPRTPLRAPLDGAPILHTYELPGRHSGPEAGPEDGYDDPGPRQRTKSLRRATLASSGLPHTGLHYPMLDVDHHVEVYASSTPGRHHIYIGHGLRWEQYMNLLQALVQAGLVEEGFARASEARGYSTLRLPWIRKQESLAKQESRLRFTRQWSWYGETAVTDTERARQIRVVEGRITAMARSSEPEWLPEVAKLFGRRRVTSVAMVAYDVPYDPSDLWVQLRQTAVDVRVEAIEEARARMAKMEARADRRNVTSFWDFQ